MSDRTLMLIFGLAGAVMQMFSHGILAGLLFAVVGRMVYERTHTRKLADLRQLPLHKLLPFAAVVFVIAGLASENVNTPLGRLGGKHVAGDFADETGDADAVVPGTAQNLKRIRAGQRRGVVA